MSLVQYTHDHRAIVVPLPETLTATYTATTEAGPRPGPAVPVVVDGELPPSMALDTSGTLDAALDEVELVTLQAGTVGTATIRWRYDGEFLRSWDPPTAISAWEKIDHSNSLNKYQHPHAIQRPDDGLLLVSVTAESTIAQVWTQLGTGKWSSVDVEDTGNATRTSLAWLPRGRGLCFYSSPAGSSRTQIRMARTDDSGGTWTGGSTACLPAPIGVPVADISRIRAVYLAGQILLLVWYVDTTDVIAQYVSTDEGGSFQLVEIFSTADKGCPDAVAHAGSIYVAYISYEAGGSPTDLEPRLHVLASASQPLSSAAAIDANGATTGANEWGAYGGGLLTEAECALLSDSDGALYLYGLDYDTGAGTRQVAVRRSTDGGSTWGTCFINGHGGAAGVLVHWVGDINMHLRGLTVARERGRAVLVHGYRGNVVNDDGSLCAAYLGGWSTVGLPEDAEYDLGAGVAGWDTVWLAIDKPSDTGTEWVETLTGAATAVMGASGMTLTTAAGETAMYTATPVTTGAVDDGILAEFHVTVTSGSALHTVRISDGADDFSVRVTVTGTTATLRDLNGATDLGNIAVEGTDGVSIRIALDKAAGAWTTNVGRVRAWAMNTGPYVGGPTAQGPPADRKWTSIATSDTVTSGPSNSNRVQFGCTDAAVIVCRMTAFAPGLYVAGNIADNFNGVARGRTVPGPESPLHITGGLRIHGIDGPTVSEDEWHVATDYEYAVTALNPRISPSPRRPWRSAATGTIDIVLSDLDLGWRTGDPIALYLSGCNFPTATLYRDGLVKVMDIDLREGVTGLAFARSRNQVVPAAGGPSATFPFHEGGLVGSRIDFGGTDVRRIRSCHAGDWLAAGAAGDYPSARLVLEDYDAGDPATGTMSIRMHSGLFIVTTLQSTDTLTLRIPSGSSAEGYWTIGAMVIGRVRPLAWQYSRGRSRGLTPSYDLKTTRGGARHARRLAPARPSVTISWDDGVLTTGLHTVGTAPDHMTLGYSGADAWGAYADTPSIVAGIFEEVGGACLPVVLCPAIPQISAATTATTPIQLTNPEAAIYGRFVNGSFRREALPNIRGDELRDPGEANRFSLELEVET